MDKINLVYGGHLMECFDCQQRFKSPVVLSKCPQCGCEDNFFLMD